MTLTKRKKQVKLERKICNESEKCIECGASIKHGSHHFLCSACWIPGKLYTEEMQKKLREMKKRRV